MLITCVSKTDRQLILGSRAPRIVHASKKLTSRGASAAMAAELTNCVLNLAEQGGGPQFLGPIGTVR